MGISILVIEPDGYTADHLDQMFSGDGRVIEHVTDGRTGFQRLREVSPDVAFIDLYLPDVDGREFLNEVTTSGLEYPLENNVLLASSTRGVSNVFTAESAVVEVRAGVLLAIHQPS